MKELFVGGQIAIEVLGVKSTQVKLVLIQPAKLTIQRRPLPKRKRK
jgi:sRNA-binding carbon storage regulator CsrA